MSGCGDIKKQIKACKETVLEGGEITFDEALRLIAIEDPESLQMLCEAAGELTRKFHSREAGLCSLINAKSYLCGEDCAFCAQSVHFRTQADRYELLPADDVVRAAKNFEEQGIRDFCVVTSGVELNDSEFESVLEMFRRLRRETSLNLDGSLGKLTPERIENLKAAGVRRINNNLQTSPDFYSKIVSTHTYRDRLESLKALQAGGMEICSGGILGMGESGRDRVKLAFELKPFKPHCLPVNLLHPRPGTPLEGLPVPNPDEMIKTIAVFRFIHPRANIKLAGGRERNLSPRDQERALQSGANGLIAGGYLTSSGNPVEKDFEMLQRAGYDLPNRSHESEKRKPTGRPVSACQAAADLRC